MCQKDFKEEHIRKKRSRCTQLKTSLLGQPKLWIYSIEPVNSDILLLVKCQIEGLGQKQHSRLDPLHSYRPIYFSPAESSQVMLAKLDDQQVGEDDMKGGTNSPGLITAPQKSGLNSSLRLPNSTKKVLF